MKASKVNLDTWLELCLLDQSATFFQTPMWFTLCSRYLKSSVESYTTGSQERYLINFITYRKPWRFRKIYESSPFGNYGGYLSTEINGTQFLDEVVKNKIVFIRENPYDLHTYSDQYSIDNEDFSYAIDISSLSGEITSSWSTSHIRAYRSAQEQGLIFSSDHSSESWNAYFQLYQLSLNRWGSRASNNYRRSFFEELSQIDSKYCKLFSVHDKKEMLSSAIFFQWNGRLHYWAGVNHEKGLKLGAAQFLFYHAISYCMDQKCTSLDFNPSGGHKGVETFKQRFGAEKIKCDLRRYGKQQ